MSQVKTGLGGGTVTLGNKGAVGLRFKIKLQAQRSLTLCFVCSHLAAHRKDVEARNRDWKVTNETMRFDLSLDSMMHNTASKKQEDEMTLWEFAAARFSEMPYVVFERLILIEYTLACTLVDDENSTRASRSNTGTVTERTHDMNTSKPRFENDGERNRSTRPTRQD